MEATQSLNKFTVFSKLPPELQIKIWKHAIPPPRLVRVNVRLAFSTHRFKTNTPVPGVLVACKNSRETILRVYTTCLVSGEKTIRLDGANDVLVLFSSSYGSCPIYPRYNRYERDTLYHKLPWLRDESMDQRYLTMFSGIKNLAMPNETRYHSSLSWFLSLFQSLERYFPLEYYDGHDLNNEEDKELFRNSRGAAN
ncbi:hypothetical protein N431DRAFT_123552 [Stipitochalara longipes BDJ]|nr:hypothetical protein N431DRAFT_123552 [Stipitochalara longipes BDJ]